MTDAYKATIRRAAEAVCDAFGTAYFEVGFLGAKHWEDVEKIITKHLTHPHSPYECYWRDRALAAEKALEEQAYEAACVQQPLESQ